MLHARAEGARRERVLGFADHELDVVERLTFLNVFYRYKNETPAF